MNTKEKIGFVNLPVEICIEIIEFLNYKDACNLCLFLHWPKDIALMYFNWTQEEKGDDGFLHFLRFEATAKDVQVFLQNKPFYATLHLIECIELLNSGASDEWDETDESDEWDETDESDESEETDEWNESESDEWEDLYEFEELDGYAGLINLILEMFLHNKI